MLTNSELTAILRENGYKVTPQRLAVYETLAATHEHPSAEMLYKTLRPKYPSMSFATVYKTVEILNRLHVIQIINTGEDSFRYDADISDHHHVQCTCCGKVEDLFNVDYSGIMAQAEKESKFPRRKCLPNKKILSNNCFHTNYYTRFCLFQVNLQRISVNNYDFSKKFTFLSILSA